MSEVALQEINVSLEAIRVAVERAQRVAEYVALGSAERPAQLNRRVDLEYTLWPTQPGQA